MSLDFLNLKYKFNFYWPLHVKSQIFQSNKEENSSNLTVDFKIWGKAWNNKRSILLYLYAEDLIRFNISGTYTV